MFALIISLSLFGIDLYIRLSTQNYIKSVEEVEKLDIDFDCIVVLGAGLNSDGSPSPMLQERLDKGIELYERGLAKKMIMSGDHENTDHDEVNAMKNYAIEKGVPSEDIFMDHAGLSTYDSMYRTKDIFQAKNALVVTQKYHLYRAVYIGKTLDLTTYGVDAEKTVYNGAVYREMREVLARIKDFFKCIIKPNSTYKGKAIPVFGNGNVTNDKEYAIIEKYVENSSDKDIYINEKNTLTKIKDIVENTSRYKNETCDCIPTHILKFNMGETYYIIESTDSVRIRKKDRELITDKDETEFIKALLDS